MVNEVINKIGYTIENIVETKYANDVERVYVAKIADYGGYDNLTTNERRMLMSLAKDEVALRLKYRLWAAIW